MFILEKIEDKENKNKTKQKFKSSYNSTLWGCNSQYFMDVLPDVFFVCVGVGVCVYDIQRSNFKYSYVTIFLLTTSYQTLFASKDTSIPPSYCLQLLHSVNAPK